MPARFLLAFLLLSLGTGCGDVAPALPPDAGPTDAGDVDGGQDAGTPDGGAGVWAFPEPVAVAEDAPLAAVAVSPGGPVSFVFYRDGPWLWRDPPATEPTSLFISAARPTELRLAAAPTGDHLLAIWNDGRAVFIRDGVPGPQLSLYGGMASLQRPGLTWTGAVPLVTAQTGRIEYDGTTYPGQAFAFPVPPDGLSDFPLPDADPSVAVEEVPDAFEYYQAANTVLDRGDAQPLFFSKRPAADVGPRHARWYRLKQTPWAPGAAGRYLVPTHEGTFEIPGPPDLSPGWIQAHDLGEERYALTWTDVVGAMVFDVFVAGLTLDSSGVPSLTTPAHNVSSTIGLTQNSDHPIVRPTGDGRYWVAWRESEYGPRVAILGPDFAPTAVTAPSAEHHVRIDAPLSAVVDESGDLHLAASFSPDGSSVEARYYVLRLADAPAP